MDMVKNAFINLNAFQEALVVHAPRTPFPSQIPSTTTRSTRSHKPSPFPLSSLVPLRLAHAPTKVITPRSYHERLLTPDWRLLRERPGKAQDIHDVWRMEVSSCSFRFVFSYLETNNSNLFCS